ncbi:autotransporter outer membrane beta-barrel domain-containing protein [Enterobacteriaceae bacterium Kacie_13]|nr:autotransporter outer membrane beta-barrel domain-containing protein [Enterobacteriaceae bacterium Kacie_13]
MAISGRTKTLAAFALLFLLGRITSFALHESAATAADPAPAQNAYVTAPYLNREYGFKTVGTYLERESNAPKNRENGTWGLLSGSHNADTYDTAHHASNIWFAQIGKDLYQEERSGGGQRRAGVIATLGNQTTDTKDSALRMVGQVLSTGNISTASLGIGGYYSATTSRGAYLNIVNQNTFYREDLSTRLNAKPNGYGSTISVEVGKPFRLGENWAIEPQAQFITQHLHMDSFDTDNSHVKAIRQNSGQVRGGLRLFRQAQRDIRTLTPYFHIDMVSNVGDKSAVTVNTVEIEPPATERWLQDGIGLTANLSKRVAFFSDITHYRNLSLPGMGYEGQLGINVSFR